VSIASGRRVKHPYGKGKEVQLPALKIPIKLADKLIITIRETE
jgi:hypothetical protein